MCIVQFISVHFLRADLFTFIFINRIGADLGLHLLAISVEEAWPDRYLVIMAVDKSRKNSCHNNYTWRESHPVPRVLQKELDQRK